MFPKGLGRVFVFFQREHSGAVLLLLIAVALALIPRIIWSNQPPQIINSDMDSTEVAYWLRRQSEEDSLRKRALLNKKFNRVTEDDFIRLGINRQNARTLFFKIKSGEFKTLREINRFAGPDSTKIQKLLNFEKQREYSVKNTYSAQNQLELNSADSAQLLSLKGIGPYFAKRIIDFRRKLGGFYSPEQLKDIYNIDTSAISENFALLIVNKRLIRKMSIDPQNLGELRAHPYFSEKQIQLLLRFKNQHGKLTEGDFRAHPAFSKEARERMIHYIQFDTE